MKFIFLSISLILFSYSSWATQRVVSTLPSITEMIYFLQAENKLVGVTPYCSYPKEAKKISKIGSSFKLNYEELIKVKPTLVFLAPVKGTKNEENLKRLGLNFKHIPYERLNDIEEGLNIINKTLSLNKEGLIKEHFASLKQLTSKKPLKILVVIGEDFRDKNLLSVRAAGGETFYGDILKRLGHKNVMEKSQIKYPVLNLEKLLKLEFDFILRVGENHNKGQDIKKKWQNSLFKTKVKFIFADYAVIPGPRIKNFYEDLREKLHARDK